MFVKKVLIKTHAKLLFSILLTISLFIGSCVSVSAVDNNNLISYNFNDWSKLPEYAQYTTLLGNSNPNGIQGIICGIASEVNDYKIAVGGIYDISDSYSVGDNYELSFEFLSSDNYTGGSLGLIGTDKAFSDYSSLLIVGIGSYNNNEVIVDEQYSIIIDSSNYNDYINGNIKLAFEMPSGLVNPCVALSFACVNADADQIKNVYLTFRNFQLINKSLEKEDNFLSRIFEWFETKFKSIGDSFSYLADKLVDLKNDFISSISNLGNTIKGFFDDLWLSIEGLFNKFKNLFLYFDINGDVNYVNLFPIKDSSVNGADDFDVVVDGLNEFVVKFRSLANYIIVPCTMLTDFGEKFILVPPLVMVSLIGLVAMRLFGVRRDS